MSTDIVKELRDVAEWTHRVTGASVKRQVEWRAADEIERLRWLIANGERYFGTLWREASEQDIYQTQASLARASDPTGTPHP